MEGSPPTARDKCSTILQSPFHFFVMGKMKKKPGVGGPRFWLVQIGQIADMTDAVGLITDPEVCSRTNLQTFYYFVRHRWLYCLTGGPMVK